MEVKEEKRPFFGIDKYLHFGVLALSCINLFQLVPNLTGAASIGNVLSVLLSLMGLFAFWLIYKQKTGGELLILLWSIPQLVIFVNYPAYTIDLSQGFSIPIGMSFESRSNGFTEREITLSFNIISGILIGASLFRLKNKSFYKTIRIHPIGIEGLNEFSSTIEKRFYFGGDKKMLILKATSGAKTYALQVDRADKLKFDDKEMEYFLCEVDTKMTKEEILKPYEFKLLGKVIVTIV